MRIFLYEYITGGGLLSSANHQHRNPLFDALLPEGAAMVTALASDLAKVSGVELVVFRDIRCAALEIPAQQVVDVRDADEERRLFDRTVSEADGVILIAPELDGALYDRAVRVEQAGGRLLSPSSEMIAVCGDKHRTAQRLVDRGVLVPMGILLSSAEMPPEDVQFPLVAKPVDGAGSHEVCIIPDEGELDRWMAANRNSKTSREVAFRLERFCPGDAVSVAALCTPGGLFTLPACRQRLSSDGKLKYLGGELPLPTELANRADSLALRALAALDLPLLGYVGVDIVLGESIDGTGDVVIEINPRLTTSYVGLRALAISNLAAAMLDVAEGKPPELSFHHRAVQFEPNGVVRLI